MSWIESLSSAIGIPAGGVALAVSVYAACAAAEKEARKDTLKDIASVLQHKTWHNDLEPAKFMRILFDHTFGKAHLTLKCFARSCLATITIVSILALQFLAYTPYKYLDVFVFSNFNILIVFVIACVTDYVALYKSRLVVNYVGRHSLPLILIVILDVFFSIMIATAVIIFVPNFIVWIVVGHAELPRLFQQIPLMLKAIVSSSVSIIMHRPEELTAAGVLLLSTVITSLWAVMIFSSTLFIRIVVPIQAFTNWFFPVEERPIRAIGIVAAGLILITSFVWALIRPLFA